MVVNEGIGNDGMAGAGSVSLVLRRDRGRCSPVERMKGSLNSNPLAPDELRFRVEAGARSEAAGGASDPAPACDVGGSMSGIFGQDVSSQQTPRADIHCRVLPNHALWRVSARRPLEAKLGV
jgi:hypothetical protein